MYFFILFFKWGEDCSTIYTNFNRFLPYINSNINSNKPIKIIQLSNKPIKIKNTGIQNLNIHINIEEFEIVM